MWKREAGNHSRCAIDDTSGAASAKDGAGAESQPWIKAGNDRAKRLNFLQAWLVY
jgi:hypothetical protein